MFSGKRPLARRSQTYNTLQELFNCAEEDGFAS